MITFLVYGEGVKRKTFIPLPAVAHFIEAQPAEVQREYVLIVGRLEADGFLQAPFGEKVEPGLFVMRIRGADGNARVFYVYVAGNMVYGIHGYVKKTGRIPQHELEQARRIARRLADRR